MPSRSFLLTALPALLLAGCPDRTISEVVVSQQGAQTKSIPTSADIDILFVVDNSASTLDKQTVFAANFPKFVQALDAFPTGRPNLHIAVVDTTIDIGVPGFGGCPSPNTVDNGTFQSKARVAGCSPPNGAFISDVASGGARMTNYPGNLDTELQCIAQVGASGCGFEAPLEAMKRALDGSNPANAGFLRKGAYLAVIFLTDEDDASTKAGAAGQAVFQLDPNSVGGPNDYRVQPLFAYQCDSSISASAAGTYSNCKPRTDSYLSDPSSYAGFLSTVKDPSQIVVAVIAGPPPGLMTDDSPPLTANSATDVSIGSLTIGPNTQQLALEPSCTATVNGNPAIGRPAVRLASFLENFGTRGKFYSICQSDYSPALADIGKTLFNAISPCLEGAIDATDEDPNNPGTQLDCTVVDEQDADSSMPAEKGVPACKMTDANTPDLSGTLPCFWTPNDPTSCPSPDTGWELKIERGGMVPPTGTLTDVECAVGGPGAGSN